MVKIRHLVFHLAILIITRIEVDFFFPSYCNSIIADNALPYSTFIDDVNYRRIRFLDCVGTETSLRGPNWNQLSQTFNNAIQKVGNAKEKHLNKNRQINRIKGKWPLSANVENAGHCIEWLLNDVQPGIVNVNWTAWKSKTLHITSSIINVRRRIHICQYLRNFSFLYFYSIKSIHSR